MSERNRNSPEVKKYLRCLGNPYAAEQMFDSDDPADAQSEHRRANIRIYENPYRSLAEEAREELESEKISRPSRRAVSKADFVSGCRNIFEQYIPPFETRKLRAHHREFILRNQERSPTARGAILRELDKYDLRRQGLKPQFNRERDEITEEKLRAIERLADGEES